MFISNTIIMIGDKNIKNSLKILDDICAYLISECGYYTANFAEIYKKLTGREIEEYIKANKDGILFNIGAGKLSEIDLSNTTFAEGMRVNEACTYLFTEGYVVIDSGNNIKISFKGIMQYGKGGFIKAYRSEKYKSFLDHFNVYVTIAISLASLAVGYYFH